MACTIIIAQGSTGELSGWDRVASDLINAGHPILSIRSHGESLKDDAESLTNLIGSIDGQVLLVGHSYGGAVISAVSPESGDIAGLAFISAFAPEPGESCVSLSTMFADGPPVELDPPQKPALSEPITVQPLWRLLPTWFLFGSQDPEIPAEGHHYMAKRAGSRRTVEVPGASRTVAVSHPALAADIVLEAARLPRWAEPLIP